MQLKAIWTERFLFCFVFDYVETISNDVPSAVLTESRSDLDHLVVSTDCN